MAAQPYLFQLFGRYFDPGFIVILIEHRLDFEPSTRPSASNEIDDSLVVDQRLSFPVQTNKRKEPVLDLVPFAGAGWIVTNRNRYSDLIRQLL